MNPELHRQIRTIDPWLAIYAPTVIVALCIVAIVYLADLAYRIVWWWRIRKSKRSRRQ
jgi:peptidoglycan/LPS O-acetylase OafA/YrhL